MKHLALLLLLFVLPFATASADTKQPEAKRHLVAGATHFDAGRFAEALAEFEASYQLDADPDTLYSIAMAERKLGRCHRALPRFREYIASRGGDVPAGVEKYITECWLALPPPQANKPCPLPPEPIGGPPPLPWYKNPASGAVIVGTAGLAVGVAFLVASSSTRDQAMTAQYSDSFDALLEEATGERRIGVTFLVSGAVLAGAGIGYHLWTRSRATDADPLTSVSTDGRSITFARSF